MQKRGVLHIKQLNSALVFFVSCTAILIGPFIASLIDSESLGEFSAVQSEFFIDATYYFYLGGEINNLVAQGSHEFWDAITELSPNRSTVGVVLISFVFRLFVDSIQMGALVLSGTLVALMTYLRKTGVLGRYSEFLLISGMIPYLYLPSKESIFLIGMLTFLARFSVKRPLLPTIIGASLMFLARPEAFLILLAAAICARMLKSKKAIRAAFILVALVLYFTFIRETLAAIATIYEISNELKGLVFCSIGPINVCVRNGAFLEQVAVNRIFVTGFIYIDWLADFIELVANPADFTNGQALIRISNVIHLPIFFAAIFGAWRLRNFGATWTVYFPILYFLTFSGVLFFQSSRQVVFVTMILFLLTRLNPRIVHP